MVYRNLRQVHLQEVGLTKTSGNHDFFNIFSVGQIAGQIPEHIPRQIPGLTNTTK
jgi:hypothetical protein